jgi:hypothetical protein
VAHRPSRRPSRRRASRGPVGVPGLHIWLPAVAVAVLLVVVVVFPGLRLGAPSQRPELLILGPIVNATVALGPSVGEHLAYPFYSIVFQTGTTPTYELQTEGAFFNTTPITLFRFGGPDNFDPTTGILYQAPASGGAYTPTVAPPDEWNFTWMKAWCDSRSPPCASLGYLPAEENNTQAAVHMAEWVHDVLDWAPTAWEFGNEPEGWTHYGENRSAWSTHDESVPTPAAYATMVHDYIDAIHALFPLDRFVGIEASDPTAGGGLIPDTAAVDGSLVAAMAYHYYPPPENGGLNLTDFYGSLIGPENLTGSVAEYRAAVSQGCAECDEIPIALGEYQAGPYNALSPLATTYAGAPFMAASVIEAIRANLTTFTPFDNGLFLDPQSGAVLPEGLLYQRILENMTMGTDVATTVEAPGVNGVFSILIHNGTRTSLLVVNTDTTASLRLFPPTSVFPTGRTGSYYLWGPSVPDPIAFPSTSLPASYEIPEEGIFLLDDY